MKTHECEPTLNDTDVIEFCKKGFLLLEGVVSDELNRRTLEFVDQRPRMPTEILDESWFVDGVILQPDAAGAVRSLLGNNFSLPNLMSNHRIQCPGPGQEWHTDGGAVYGPEVDYLQVFYYPQECPKDLGPTEVLPGSHFLYARRDYMAHYGRIRGSYYTVAPAGSIFITDYSIWHRRSESRASGLRNLLKYNYWRTASPKRDWIVDPGFDLATADYGTDRPTYREDFQDSYDASEMYFWLRGDIDKYNRMGGQAWPLPPSHKFNDRPFGVPEGVT